MTFGGLAASQRYQMSLAVTIQLAFVGTWRLLYTIKRLPKATFAKFTPDALDRCDTRIDSLRNL
jgi:hypothetical protein